MQLRRDLWRNFDFLLFGGVLVLGVFGVVMIQSAIAGSPGLADIVNNQILFLIIALGVIIGMSILDYHYYSSLSNIMYLFILGLLLFSMFLGEVAFGSKRWIPLGSFNLQPSELAKMVNILVLADFFNRTKNQPHDLTWVAKSLAITLGMTVWILLQPDLSSSIVMVVIWFSILWLAGLPPKFLLIFAVVGILGGVGAFPFLEEYQQQRVLSFVFPDPEARYGNSYNVEQALVTIGSGGWFGQGYGHSSQIQLRFQKVRHTDFIFSAISAEFGFVGTVLIMLALLFVIWRCFVIARNASEEYGALIAYGFGIVIFFQMMVNIGVNLNLMPVTGLTLPFISYGGSSMLSLALGIGLVESVAVHSQKRET
ncbi:MAG: rod shape-determining protein RodA [Anaerolineaceae bacterium]|nr:rod shape-determining protein RodA [Anaerolineaceae bacterium]